MEFLTPPHNQFDRNRTIKTQPRILINMVVKSVFLLNQTVPGDVFLTLWLGGLGIFDPSIFAPKQNSFSVKVSFWLDYLSKVLQLNDYIDARSFRWGLSVILRSIANHLLDD